MHKTRASATRGSAVALALALVSGMTWANWVEFQNETATRLVAAPDVGVTDLEEKDYAWGDVDRDDDVDLVVARKEPFATSGKRTNVLLLNEGGVLVDRTAELASASDVEGDQGFLTPTNDRDMVLADLDLDGWLDIVTAVSLSTGAPKHIGHPRVYMNLGEDAESGEWLGFRHEDARIPTMLSRWGTQANPRFVSVSAGDVTGDGYPDLWFGDSDLVQPVELDDFDNRLLINLGEGAPGFFVDETEESFEGHVIADLPFQASDITPAVGVADVDGDERADLVKVSSRSNPNFVGLAYDDPEVDGRFDTYDTPYVEHSGYFVSTGDLNLDGRLDLVVTDDGADRYLLNRDEELVPSFTSHLFEFAHSGPGSPAGDDGFGSNSVIADLNNDQWPDVVIADVDLEIEYCGGRAHIYRNAGGVPGGEVVLREQTTGTNCEVFWGNPASCVVASIPADHLEGVHDVAIFDIDGNGWEDLVLGRCGGTEIWMNQPLTPVGSIPDGDAVPGTPLTVGKEPNGRISLSWGDSCGSEDADYGIYHGPIGSFGLSEPVTCTTAGLTARIFTPAAGSRFYLVVPTDGASEGSYGRFSGGIPRPPSAFACLPQAPGDCE